jgi:hypothetical protein
MSRPPSPPSTTLRLEPSTCTPVQLHRGPVAGSHRCAWLDHGRPSLYVTLGIHPGFTIDVCRPTATNCVFILDALAFLMGLAVASQLLQHDDAPDAALAHGVGHRLRCVKPHHTRSR